MVTAERAQRRSVFASPQFRQYFIGQAFSNLGDGLKILTVPLLIFSITHSAISTGLGFVVEIAPFALLGPVAGSFADRLDRRKMMIVCDLIRFAVMASFAFMLVTHTLNVAVLYSGLFVLAVCAGFFLGGQASSIPFLLGPTQTTAAMSALIAVESASNLVTPALGGLLYGLWGPLPALSINALTYALSMASLSLIPSLGPDGPSGIPRLRELREDFVIGFRTMLGDTAMRTMAACSLCLNFFGFGTYTILVPYLKREFHASDHDVGFFFAIAAIGQIIGSLSAGRINNRWPFGQMVTIALAFDAVLFLPFPFVHVWWLAACVWGITSIAVSFEFTQILGWRLRVTPPELVGRVFGSVRLVVLSGIIPGSLTLGWIADHRSGHDAMIVGAFGYLAIAAVFCALPVVRNERR